MIKLSANETKWSSLLARTHVFILYISISIFDFGPEKLPGLSRNVLLNTRQSKMQISCALGRVLCSQYSQRSPGYYNESEYEKKNWNLNTDTCGRGNF